MNVERYRHCAIWAYFIHTSAYLWVKLDDGIVAGQGHRVTLECVTHGSMFVKRSKNHWSSRVKYGTTYG